MQKNACWVFETVRIILLRISLICFTEKVYGSSPYSPKKNENQIQIQKSKNRMVFIVDPIDIES